LSTGTFDVLVVGGGIVGARIAFEASRSGLKVALVDAGDFGGATSSASGKLVHGGLRYLRTGKVRLVREAHRERRVLVELERSRGTLSGAVLKRLDGEGLLTVRCRTVVNATGPWLDHLLLLEDPKRKPAVRLSKGVHLVLPPEAEWRVAFTLSLDDGRHVYAVPWRGMLLLGTTDTAYEGDPGAVTPVPAEVAYLLATASRFLP
jgi:glycerol-3-phosphate dehydrogenase